MAKTYPLKQVRLTRLLSLTVLAWAFCFMQFGIAQVTTSSMTGKVTDEAGEPLIGANVVAVHEPSGTSYGTSTDVDGNFRFPGMRVGGPYRVTVTYTGFAEKRFENINLRLGEAQKRDFKLTQSSIELSTITVVAQSGVSGQSAGSSTQITGEEIDVMPTLNRSVGDYLKLSPQSSAFGDGTTFAGMNNRYNAIFIDGAVNNDVFGLASSGTNGGQTGISPFSIDIIDQFQVVLSPYDVTLGGFAGGGVNAVTKSGTNTFSGTAYYFLQNESLAGKTNGVLASRLMESNPNFERTKLAEFSQTTYGASLGGPIVKDKAFFFLNVELQDDETPSPFEFGTYAQPDRATEAELNALRNTLISQYGYDPGGFSSISDQLEGLKLFGKVDINLNESHRLTLRHQYTKAEQTNRNASSSSRINFANNGVYFPSTTNSSALELNSRFGANLSNTLIVGLTSVNDDRDAIGGDFPYVIIDDANGGDIQFGTEEFSTANQLEQTIFTITDNLKLYKGDHTITIGTHNEFYSIYNVFIPQNYGSYDFDNIDAFLAGTPSEYDRSYSLVDDLTGDGTAAAADFNALQLGFYVQDEWSATKNLTLTAGLRLDIPMISGDPDVHPSFNSTSLPDMRAFYDIANDVEGGQAPDGQLMISPRLGFEYDVNRDRSTVLRGGLGIFTSRIPFVWPGAMFNNNGLTIGNVDENDIPNLTFVGDVNNQYTDPNFSVPSGDMNLFTKDFKYPQVFRANLAIDKVFGTGWKATLEGLYTNKINDVVYTNINSNPTVDFNFTNNGGDTRPVYVNSSIDNRYGAVYVGHNTSEGNSYNITASLSKKFDFGLTGYLAYTYGDAHSVNDGTSSQNSSQWRGQISTNGRNFPAYGRSDYALGHRIISSLTYKHHWTDDGGVGTAISLFYNGQSGAAFSYVISGSSARNINEERGSTSRNRSLIYIPRDINDINLVEYTSGGTTVTVAEQWANLNAIIEDDKSLSENRGSYAEKNGATAPFVSYFDLAIRQDLGSRFGNNLHKLQLTLDIFNLANLINKDWGVSWAVPGSDFNNYYLYQFDGYEADGTTPKFSYRGGDAVGKDRFDIGGTGSRWRMRVGIRYSFN